MSLLFRQSIAYFLTPGVAPAFQHDGGSELIGGGGGRQNTMSCLNRQTLIAKKVGLERTVVFSETYCLIYKNTLLFIVG